MQKQEEGDEKTAVASVSCAVAGDIFFVIGSAFFGITFWDDPSVTFTRSGCGVWFVGCICYFRSIFIRARQNIQNSPLECYTRLILQLLGIGGYFVGSAFGFGPASSLEVGADCSDGINGAYFVGSAALFLDSIQVIKTEYPAPRALLEFLGGFFFLLAGIGPYTNLPCTQLIGLWSWLVGSCGYLGAHAIDLQQAKDLEASHAVPSTPCLITWAYIIIARRYLEVR
jgi:hypothetical protein